MTHYYPTKKLGEVVYQSTRKNTQGALPYLGMEMIQSQTGLLEQTPETKEMKSTTFYFYKSCVLYGKLRPYLNKVFAPDFEGHCTTELVPLVPGENLLKEWLAYWLRSERVVRFANNTTTGSRMPRANMKEVMKLKIPVPPLETQRRIVEKIETLMSHLAEAKRLRTEAREETSQLLPAALHQVFSQAQENGWEEFELKEVCDLSPSKNEIKDVSDDTEVSFIPMKSVDDNTQTITTSYSNILGNVKKGYNYFQEGDILFAKITPCMENGKVAIAENLKNGLGFGTTEFHVVRPRNGVLSKWVFHYLRDPQFRKWAEENMTGSAGQKRFSRESLAQAKIPVPPIEEQHHLVIYLDTVAEHARTLLEIQDQAQTDLTDLEQSILHKAFEGELT